MLDIVLVTFIVSFAGSALAVQQPQGAFNILLLIVTFYEILKFLIAWQCHGVPCGDLVSIRAFNGNRGLEEA